MKSTIDIFQCLRTLLLIASLSLVVAACSGGAGGPENQEDAASSSATLKSLQISLNSDRLINGLPGQAYVSGLFSDNSSVDLSDLVQWASSDANVARVDAVGTISSLQSGSTVISASVGGISATALLVVDEASLLALTITPTNPQLIVGVEQPLSAMGEFDNGARYDVTDEVTWNSDDSAIISLSETGLVTAINAGTVAITASLAEISVSTNLTVSAATLTRIEIVAEQNHLPVGAALQLYSIAVFSDNTVLDFTDQVNWNTDKENVATVNGGLIAALNRGTSIISLSYLGQEASIEITIDNAALISLNISPSVPTIIINGSLQFYATGIYSDGSTLDVTDQTTWVSSDELVTSIGNSVLDRGEVKGLSVGHSNITAYYAGQSQESHLNVTAASLQNIEISPAMVSIAQGTSVSFSVLGHYDDGSTLDLTDQVNWSLSEVNIAKVEAKSGVFKSSGVGSGRVIVSIDGHVNFSILTVTPATLERISISPEDINIAAGYQTQLLVTGYYSDASSQNISDDVIWQISDRTVATVSNAVFNKGELTAVQSGTVNVTATLDSVSSNVQVIVSTAELVGITVQIENNEMLAGHQQQLFATGIFSDDSRLSLTQEVAWSSSNVVLATLRNTDNEKGLIAALGQGSVVVTATIDGISGFAELNVLDDPNAAVSLSLSASPNVLLNNGADSTTIQVILKAAESHGRIADNTEISMTVIEGDNSYSQTLFTTNGSAHFSLSSTYDGYIEIQVSLANGIHHSGYIFSTSNFSNVIAKVGLIYAQYEGDNLLTGSWFAFLMQNISNKIFDIEEYEFSNGVDSQIYLRMDINDGQLGGGEQYILKVMLSNDQPDEGLSGVMRFHDSMSVQSFTSTIIFTAP